MTEKAYAKLNITLEVLGKKDGYHLLESVVVPIDIYDTLTFEDSNVDLVVSNIFIEDNNINKALKLFKETFKIKEHVKITLDKKIPIGYGLGGSSADISGTLRGLNKFFNLNKPLKELEPLANKLGSDTLFCLYQKRAFIKGRGDIISIKEKNKKNNFLLILPKVELLTKDVFKNYRPVNTYRDFKEAFYEEDCSFIRSFAKNDLLRSALSLSKELNDIYSLLKENNFKIHMTGSGSALFITEPKNEDKIKIKNLLGNRVELRLTREI